MNWVTVLLWAIGIYFYLLLGTIVSAYSWRIYRNCKMEIYKKNMRYQFLWFLFWPLSSLISFDITLINTVKYSNRNNYISLSAPFLLIRLFWNVSLWIMVSWINILKILGVDLIFRPLIYPFRKALRNIR